ncbi:MAG: putative toxin-antitoxin system toxin component, PIN family [Deltaproteobacteria bacterium]|nr:putative toxin-antitoxin system toxin component, PIN family [Deltaproteobacteria bacterium]
MATPLVVLDTNVLVSALRSRAGASFAVVERIGGGDFEIAVSVPLVLEYEDAMLRHRGGLSPGDVRDIVDYVCSVARHQQVFFLWRPLLRDPNDDMVAEVAVAAGAQAIVTHNRRDFLGVEKLGLKIWSPQQLLERTGR